MKDYLLLLRAGIPAVNRTEEENKADMEAWGAFMGGLAQNGQLSGGLPLAVSYTHLTLPTNREV